MHYSIIFIPVNRSDASMTNLFIKHFMQIHTVHIDVVLLITLYAMQEFLSFVVFYLCRMADGQHRHIQHLFCGVGYCYLLFWISSAGCPAVTPL